jgi:hypothetical protein
LKGFNGEWMEFITWDFMGIEWVFSKKIQVYLMGYGGM